MRHSSDPFLRLDRHRILALSIGLETVDYTRLVVSAVGITFTDKRVRTTLFIYPSAAVSAWRRHHGNHRAGR
jgi:hypothetical protein